MSGSPYSRQQTLTEEIVAWEDRRNKKHVKADWQFTTADARVKLKRLYRAMGTTQGTRPDVRLRWGDPSHSMQASRIAPDGRCRASCIGDGSWSSLSPTSVWTCTRIR